MPGGCVSRAEATVNNFVVEAGTNILSGLIDNKVWFESRSLTKSPHHEWLYAGEPMISSKPAGSDSFVGESAEAIAGGLDIINSVAARRANGWHLLERMTRNTNNSPLAIVLFISPIILAKPSQ
jgi:hypothetical protein